MLSPPTSPHTTNNNAVVGPSGTDGVTFPPLPSSSPYDAACRAHHHRALQHLCFPWPAIRDVISFSTPISGSTSISSSASSSKPSTATEYHLPRAAANLFRTLSDQPADVLEYLEAPPAYVEGAGVLAGDSGNGGGGGGRGEGIVSGVDLFAAVKTQVEPFLARAASLDWLRGPPRTLAGSLERAEEAYRGFLLRGGEQVAGLWGEFELDFERGNENGNGNGNGKDVDEEEEVDEGDGDGDDDKAKSKEPGEESHQQKRRHHHHYHHHRNQIPFGVSLIWRTHRLFTAQYRLFSEGDALAELRRSVLGPGAGWKQLDEMLGDYDQQEGGAADMCECWTCERIRDEAPGFAYDRAAAAAGAGAGSPSYDVSVVQALSMEQLRSIQEDLGICHAVREKRRKQGKRKGTRSQQQQKISAGRIFSRGVKAMEDRRRSWRLD